MPDRAALIHDWCISKIAPTESVFLQAFRDASGKFTLDEGPTWDFKQSWPFSYSDPYFGGIAKLICAFSNTWGGIIIFGVHDEKRVGGSNKVLINFDKLSKSFEQLTGQAASLEVSRYGDDHNEIVALLIRPRPAATKPLRFKQKIGKYGADTIWVRLGHESLEANPAHYPVLFCRAGNPLEDVAAADVQGSLPPSPTTLKKFVGRLQVMEDLFAWLQSSDEPRTFLYGKGGSGKTTIAYEFAKLLRNSGGELSIYGGHIVDTVIFLSAKEKRLLTVSSTIQDISEPDFTDEVSLHRKILLYGRWILDERAIESLSANELRDEVKAFLDVSTCLLVIDDVDTLTTKGIDAGFDFLYKVLSRTQRGSKILYTLRNAPSHSLLNSIEVPGLAVGGDYEGFIEACATQFNVEQPKSDFRDGALATTSERRPLVIESIVALVRTAGSYKRATELFQQHVGADVREYVFVREWDALPVDGVARHLLIALSEIGRPASFKDLETVLQVEATQVIDAVGAVREMFLQIEGIGDEASYSLAQLTKQFVNSKKASVSRYDVLKARVKSFKRYIHAATPQGARITLQVERLLPPRSNEHVVENARSAWSLVNDEKIPASVSEEPIFQSVRGYVACCLKPPRITDARESFSYARKMGYEPEYLYLKAWFSAEKANGQFEGGMDVVADTVIKGRGYTLFERAFMAGQKATALYFRGRERLYTDTVDAERDLQEALKLHLFVYKINVDEGHYWSDSSFERAKNTAFSLFNLAFQTPSPWDAIDSVVGCLKQEASYADPLEAPIIETLERIVVVSTRPDLTNRYRNKLKALDSAVAREAPWKSTSVRDRLSVRIKATDALLESKLKQPR
ncbi:RNA-binding domain-containing protein [Bradyrhizobium japonicum]|uniref:RNA-binding domain-containing protein n=1 Tax=Bradyrhizobium japonicum TaxID=375 RepID=UPI002714F684|nr:RNA-binding domain-containing protein [Bradyrhizobium japonicum]WLB24474.1 putative DNA binding domain-containing protein [Bradyrhizobium japonicum]